MTAEALLFAIVKRKDILMYLDKNFKPDDANLLDLFVHWYNLKVADYDVPRISMGEVYIVWYCYTLGNAKALISTTRKDHMYYELTYNDQKGELYVDQYVKIMHTDIVKEAKIKEKQSPILNDDESLRYPIFDEKLGRYRFENTDKHAKFLSGDTQD